MKIKVPGMKGRDILRHVAYGVAMRVWTVGKEK